MGLEFTISSRRWRVHRDSRGPIGRGGSGSYLGIDYVSNVIFGKSSRVRITQTPGTPCSAFAICSRSNR